MEDIKAMSFADLIACQFSQHKLVKAYHIN